MTALPRPSDPSDDLRNMSTDPASDSYDMYESESNQSEEAAKRDAPNLKLVASDAIHAGEDSLAEWIEMALSRFEKPLLIYVYRYLKDEDRAQDIVQEAFLKLCQQSDAQRQELEAHLGQWLYTVCRNAALNVIRKEKRVHGLSDERLAMTSAGEATGQQYSPAEQNAESEMKLIAMAALDKLPPKEKECVELKFLHDMTYRQISSATGYTLSYVGYLIHHGLKHLQEIIEPKT